MGNVQSATSSCATGIEKAKDDILTVVASNTDLTTLFSEGDNTSDGKISPTTMSPSITGSERSIAPRRGSESSMGSVTTPSGDVSRQTSDLSRSSSRSSQKGHAKRFFKKVSRKTHKVMDKFGHAFHAVGHAAGNAFHCVEDFMFPHHPQFGHGHHHPHSIVPKVRGGVLLYNCHTDEEHKAVVRETVERLRPLHGAEGLRAVDLEFRKHINTQQHDQHLFNGETALDAVPEHSEPQPTTGSPQPTTSPTVTDELPYEMRLYHIKTNAPITEKNRKLFVADGDMYDMVARLCQEAVQDIMIQEGNLEWVTISEEGNFAEPIRALVSADMSRDESKLDSRPTLLIATGKGKVRAGIFSRRHLMVSGMECCTALPLVREAVKRNMNIVMIDPNVHGDRLGMVTFEKTMARVFRRWERDTTSDTLQDPENPPLSTRDLFVLSHSQSGAQLARYLLDKCEHYVPHIRAIAFTDSTHNIQWARENATLHTFLQSPKCVYFRCSKESNDNKNPMAPLESAGDEIHTDSFWQHRFGNITTRCAGTTEHSLTNWFVQSHIWDHFDSYLQNRASS